MKYKNIPIRSKVTEALSRKRRAYSPQSPLRDSRILDAKELWVLMRKFKQDRFALGQGTSDYPGFVFKTPMLAEQWLEENGIGDHEVVTIYDTIRTY